MKIQKVGCIPVNDLDVYSSVFFITAVLNLIQNKGFPWDVCHPLSRCRGSESSEYSPTSRLALSTSSTIPNPLTSSLFEEPQPLSRACSLSSLSDVSSASSSSAFARTAQTGVSVALVLHEHDIYHGSHESAPAFTLDLDQRSLRDGGCKLEGESVFTRRADLRTTRGIGHFPLVVNLSSSMFSSALKYQCISRVHRDGEEVYADIASDIRLEPYFPSVHSPIATCTTTLVPEYWGAVTFDAKSKPIFYPSQVLLLTIEPEIIIHLPFPRRISPYQARFKALECVPRTPFLRYTMAPSSAVL